MTSYNTLMHFRKNCKFRFKPYNGAPSFCIDFSSPLEDKQAQTLIILIHFNVNAEQYCKHVTWLLTGYMIYGCGCAPPVRNLRLARRDMADLFWLLLTENELPTLKDKMSETIKCQLWGWHVKRIGGDKALSTYSLEMNLKRQRK